MTGQLEARSATTALARLSINQATANSASLPQLIEVCRAAGVSAVGLWREPVRSMGVQQAAAMVTDAGLRVSSLCRGGFFPALDAAERARRIEDNKRAIEEAAGVGTDVLVLVAGGLPDGSRDLGGGRGMVLAGVAALVDHARAHGVRLAVEALHPMFCADRCVVVTLDQALDLAEQFPADVVGVVVDAYHVWWDPNVGEQIRRAGPRILSYQVCDWTTPLPAGVLVGRGMMGAGAIDLRRMTEQVRATGYDREVEVEIFNEELWALPPSELVGRVTSSYLRHVAPWA
jgi:sugar phosphate isomerase/epimerase